MVADDDDDDAPPQIVIRNPLTGECFDFDPSETLWRDMQAYCAVTGLTVEALINTALVECLECLKKSEGNSAKYEGNSAKERS